MQSQTLKTLVAVLTFNEGEKLQKLFQDFPKEKSYDILVVNDGSTDNTLKFLVEQNLTHANHTENLGVGAGIRTATEYAKKNNYEVIVIMAGNGKMLPVEIDRLLVPIYENNVDYVQGSRYLDGGNSLHLPTFRNFAIKLFTLMTNIVLGFKGTDITCGFRAYRLAIFENKDIDIHQDWLGQYEMEYYIHYKVIKSKYNVREVPVSMIYPKEGKNYSKIKPFVGWWSMVRPWIFLTLRLKK